MSGGEVTFGIAKRTFWKRVRSMAIWWGIPAVGAELCGVPRNLWVYVLMLAIPATAAGVIAGAAILRSAAARQNKDSDGGTSSREGSN